MRFAFLSLALLAGAPAFASEGAEVCVLTVTELKAPPKKPKETLTALDCGKKPSDEQKAAIALVNNALNAADALEAVARFGYEVETGNWREGYTGHQVFGVFVLVKEGDAAPAAVPADDDALEDAPEAPAAEAPAAE